MFVYPSSHDEGRFGGAGDDTLLATPCRSVRSTGGNLWMVYLEAVVLSPLLLSKHSEE